MKKKKTSERILDTAELMFAMNGGENGVSLRELATAAGVKLSSLDYHFGSKADLYRAVFERRANELEEARQEALTQAMAKPGSGLKEVVRALILPAVAARYASDKQGAAFALLTAFEATHPREAKRGILQKYYDPTAHRFIDAILAIYPDVSYQAAADAFQLMVGALVMTMVSSDRFTRLGAADRDQRGASLSIDNLTNHLVDFCVGGTHALLSRRTSES
jgi:AcrR family transcriptional regulator